MLSHPRFCWSGLFVLMVFASSGFGVEISVFTGGDPGEGLDLEGDFVYAVNISGPGGQEIGDASFEDDAVDGFFIETTHNLPTWATPEYGDTDADDDLEEIMRSIRWSNVAQVPSVVDIEMDVVSGQSYKMQMLFTESCCDRGFDIEFEGELLVDDFAIYEHHLDDIWNINSREDGVLITHEFTAEDDSLNLALGTGAPDYPDNNGHISALTLERVSVLAGDFDGDGELTAADIEILSDAVRTGKMDSQFDLDGNNSVESEDRFVWVKDLRGTWFGDANFDGEFNSSDFVQVFQRGEYEDGIAGNSTWEDGDWDGDGDFDSSDFVIAFQDGGFEQGPRMAVNTVPEPTSMATLLVCFLGFLIHRRQGGCTI